MTTHVFIVDINTFKYHVEYLFAGTGAKDNRIDFNNSSTTSLNHTTENNLVGMISDSQRVRKGDFLIFYLQQNYSKNVYEGKFYGIFKIKEDLSFLDNNDIRQYIGRDTNKSLDKCLLNGLTLEWLGNEVSCGVGMQRIDVAISLVKPNSKIIEAIELKAIEANINNIYQIQRYVDWLEQYYLSNRPSDIQPVLIAKKLSNKNSENYTEIMESFKRFNKKNNRCMPIKYVEYELEDNNLEFQEVKY